MRGGGGGFFTQFQTKSGAVIIKIIVPSPTADLILVFVTVLSSHLGHIFRKSQRKNTVM